MFITAGMLCAYQVHWSTGLLWLFWTRVSCGLVCMEMGVPPGRRGVVGAEGVADAAAKAAVV